MTSSELLRLGGGTGGVRLRHHRRD